MRAISAGFLAFIAASAIAAPVLAEDLVFTLRNRSGFTMTEFYASPHNVGTWEDDILGDSMLGSGHSTRITIADGRSQCTYDLEMVFRNGASLTDTVDLCETASYTVNP